MDIFHVLFYQPTYNLLMLFTGWFGSLGFSIILIALFSKLITLPLTNAQVKNAEKSKKLQVKFKELKEKYKNNQEKLTKEMAKVQAEVLPGQLGGCFSIIIFIIMFIQIRGVILDLVNKGYHSFNEVSYSEVLEKKEDYIKYNLPENLAEGKHSIDLKIVSSEGNTLEKKYEFEVVSNKTERVESLKTELKNLSDEQKNEKRTNLEKSLQAERASDISVFNKDIESSLTGIELSKFLFFTTESDKAYLIEKNNPDLTFFIRPPSNQTIDYSKAELKIDNNIITDNIEFQQGDPLGLNFLGVNLSKVASDFDIFNLSITAPYILIAVLSGITQYFVSKLYSGATATSQEQEDKNIKNKKKKSKEEEEPDFAEMMQQSSKQMNMLFPIFTIAISLGYFGGSSFIPMGVTLFWTAQNTFVIIQQMIIQRDSLIKKIQEKFTKLKLYFNKADDVSKIKTK